MITASEISQATVTLSKAPNFLSALKEEYNVSMKDIESQRNVGWALTENCLEYDNMVKAISEIVSIHDTPSTSRISQHQLLNKPSSETLYHRLLVVDACIDMYDNVCKSSGIRLMSQNITKQCFYYASPILRQMTRDMLLQHFSLDTAGLEYLDFERPIVSLKPKFYCHDMALKAMLKPTKSTTRQDMGVQLCLMKRFPPDVNDIILNHACDTTWNDVHFELDRINTPSSKMFRRNFKECFAIIIICEAMLHCNAIIHLQVLRDYIRVILQHTAKLEKYITPTAKQPKLLPIKLNTLVICDTRFSRKLRSDSRMSHLVVRHVTGIPDLSCSIHADVICINTLSASALSMFQFKRCII